MPTSQDRQVRLPKRDLARPDHSTNRTSAINPAQPPPTNDLHLPFNLTRPDAGYARHVLRAALHLLTVDAYSVSFGSATCRRYERWLENAHVAG